MAKAGEKARATSQAARMLKKAGIVITRRERGRMEVADLGLNELRRTGLEIVVYVNTDRYCAKELIMFPRQTCPQHRHPSVRGQRGKMETFRCRWGVVYLYVPGKKTRRPKAKPPKGREKHYKPVEGVPYRAVDSTQTSKRAVSFGIYWLTSHQIHEGDDYLRILERYIAKIRGGS